MVDKTQNWSREWKSSTNPSKQRKYRRNAPQHVKDNFISANLSHRLRDQLNTRSLQINLGDRVEVTRGDFSGSSGIVSNIDRDAEKVYINNLEVERQDGTTRERAFKPSNLQIQALNLENMERIEKYEVDDASEIQVDEEEVEEVLEEDEENEMMQQMQGGGQETITTSEDEEEDSESEEESEEGSEEPEEAEESEDESVDEGSGTDFDEVVSGTISDAKEMIDEMEEPDFNALIEAEESGKNRKTFIEYLEGKKEEN